MRVLSAWAHEHRDWHRQRPEGGLWALDLEVQRAVTAICQSSQCSERLSPPSSLTSDHWVVFEEQYRCAQFVAGPLSLLTFIILGSRLSWFKCEMSAGVQEFGYLVPSWCCPLGGYRRWLPEEVGHHGGVWGLSPGELPCNRFLHRKKTFSCLTFWLPDTLAKHHAFPTRMDFTPKTVTHNGVCIL